MASTTAIGCVVGIAALLGWSSTALAHGPCSCLDPVLAQAGKQVRIGPENRQVGLRRYPAYRVVFNPKPSDYGIAPKYLASAYRADAPTTTVLSRSRHNPTRKGRFRVPRGTPPGLYMVLIWDGGEAGAHNTWDYLHVIDSDQRNPLGVVARATDAAAAVRLNSTPSNRTRGSTESTPSLLVAVGALGGLIFGIVGIFAARVRGR